MAFDRKEYMKKYNRDPKNREAQRASSNRYRAKIVASPGGLDMLSKKKREYNATANGKRNNRNRILKFNYGISLADYEAMVSKQGGVCIICKGGGRLDRFSRLDVDHNHATGKVRGALCFRCNQGLGHFEDDPDLLEMAAAYLRERDRG